MEEEKVIKEEVVVEQKDGERGTSPPNRRVERRSIALMKENVLQFKRKLEESFPVPTRFLSLQTLLEISGEDEQLGGQPTYRGFITVIAAAGERKGQVEYIARVITFKFPPIIPIRVELESFYILLTFLLLPFRLAGTTPIINFVPSLDSLSFIFPKGGESKEISTEIQIPYRELLLFPTEEHTFLIYKKQKPRLVRTHFWNLPDFMLEE